MELSLFAEAFSEMLSRDYGEIILAALYKERCVRHSHVLWHVFVIGGPYLDSHSLPMPRILSGGLLK